MKIIEGGTGDAQYEIMLKSVCFRIRKHSWTESLVDRVF